jgi:hypothetical protein
MAKVKVWVVQGKYTTGKGSQWEDLEEITEEEGGSVEAQRLAREHQICAPYGQHKVIRRDT